MAAYIRRPVVTANRVKKVKTHFEIVGEPMRYFYGFVQHVLGWKNAVDCFGLAMQCKIAVQFYHRIAPGYSFRAIDLDFIIVLGLGRIRDKKG